MTGTKAAIIAQLQREILPLQGIKTGTNKLLPDVGLGPVKNAFVNAAFPLGAIHEFMYSCAEDAAATIGFVVALLASFRGNKGASIWISSSRILFPPAIKSFLIDPDKIIFIDLHKEKEILWATEEALKCTGLTAVIGEMQELSFIASRRLQLAVEQSEVTGFILRRNPRSINTTACFTRWKITSLPSELPGDMPGVGFPRWKVELLKVRNGKPGKWQLEYSAGRFWHIPTVTAIPIEQQKKTG
ncbi:MAG: Error-prone repair protein ImuA [Bacteroidota bacterium]